jgi:hypothetical protein
VAWTARLAAGRHAAQRTYEHHGAATQPFISGAIKNWDERQSDIARCLRFSHRDVTRRDGAREIAVASDEHQLQQAGRL